MDINTVLIYIDAVERAYGIPQGWLARLLARETGGDNIYAINPMAINPRSGAKGLAQFMPATFSWVGKYIKWARDAFNPYHSIAAAGFYLAYLAHKFGDWSLGAMAYNWGPGNVNSWLRTGTGANGQPVPAETWAYVDTVAGSV